MKAKSLLGALLMLLLTASVALAWPEGPPDKVSISGPGLKGTVEVTDKASLEGLGPEQFMDMESRIAKGPQGGKAYDIIRYINGFGSSGAFDHLRYYPPTTGNTGYVYYVKAIGYGPSQTEGRWFYATPQGDAAMARLLAKFAPASGPSAEQVSATPSKSTGALRPHGYWLRIAY